LVAVCLPDVLGTHEVNHATLIDHLAVYHQRADAPERTVIEQPRHQRRTGTGDAVEPRPGHDPAAGLPRREGRLDDVVEHDLILVAVRVGEPGRDLGSVAGITGFARRVPRLAVDIDHVQLAIGLLCRVAVPRQHVGDSVGRAVVVRLAGLLRKTHLIGLFLKQLRHRPLGHIDPVLACHPRVLGRAEDELADSASTRQYPVSRLPGLLCDPHVDARPAGVRLAVFLFEADRHVRDSVPTQRADSGERAEPQKRSSVVCHLNPPAH
jgi:hypothetical protein